MSLTPASLTGRAVARAGLGVSLLIAALVRLPHLWFVPIWDGRAYWNDCLQPALTSSFDPLAFNCFGHRSMLYMLTVSWPQYFSHASALLLNLAHLGISLLIIWAFYRVVVSLLPPGESGATALAPALATVVFACMPIWTAASINLNPDTGVLAAFLFALGFFLRRRIVLATVAGMFLVLSKAMGLLLWLVLIAIEMGFTIHEKGWRNARRPLLRRAGLLLPVIAYVAVGAALTATERPATWAPTMSLIDLLLTFLSIDLLDPIFGAYVADLFVLNFSWVMTAVIVAWLAAIGVAALRSRPFPLPAGVDRPRATVTALAALAAFYLLTRYPTYNNPRYLLPAFPMVVIVFMAATVAIVQRPRVRAALFVLAAVLQLASMSRTIDPVSKFIFGTFRFGDHELLAMTSRTDECCGYGRDQLVYNLQYTAFDYTQNKLFSALRPRNGDVIGMSHAADWYTVGPLDPKTHRRTLAANGVVRPVILTFNTALKGMKFPDRLHFIGFPNTDYRGDLRLLSRGYTIKGPYAVEEEGYRLDFFALQRIYLEPPQR